jgi:mRNA interferase MazF
MNYNIATVIIALFTSRLRNYPTRVACKVEGKQGQIVLDQIRTVDKIRLFKRVGTLNILTRTKVLNVLKEMFSE